MTGNAAVIVTLNIAAIFVISTVYLAIPIGIILQDESHLNEMEI